MIPRIGKEYNDISKTPIPHVTVTLPDKSSMAVWHCVIDGPIGTPYAGGKFVLQLDFSDNYPFKSCLLYTSPSPRDGLLSRMPSSACKKKKKKKKHKQTK
eukprot:TRINITY_DN651_c0_g1_i18.p1 TRINITY_DN651_c0_g1~~TRINITY_DN651_c0_g1_i18.p1  ORF type:complete len:100 (-),score=13.05 TRINITY_DN651_c0_g1_i18:5-304(-)